MSDQKLADIRFALLADPESVEDADLLALLIGTPNSKRSSFETASGLLEQFDGLAPLLSRARGSIFLKDHDLREIPGARIVALSELVRRCGGSQRRVGTRAQALALAYLSTAAETLEAISEQPHPGGEQIRQAAELMRQWYHFASNVL